MADPYGWTNDRDYRRAYEDERARRDVRDEPRDFGPSQGSRPQDVNDDYGQSSGRYAYGPADADRYRSGPDRGPYARPYSHARYLREQEERAWL